MSILSFQNLSQSFGGYDVFRGVNGRVETGQKIGIVGPNGVGKSSFLRILTGIDEATQGTVSRTRQIRLGYLQQEAMSAFFDPERPLYDEMLDVFTELRAMEDELRHLEEQMAECATVLEEYGELQEKFAERGGYDYEVRIAQTLTGLGFGKEDWTLPLRYLSGGQKTRALLARLLLESPDILVLDEPTNHLDIVALRWLETALRQWKGALIIVSHDRYFLDNVADAIWELTPHGLEVYKGNYSAYLRQREARYDYLEKVFFDEKERLLRDFEYIKKNITSEANQDIAYGRLRRLTRDLIAIDTVGLLSFRQSDSWLQLGVGHVRTYTIAEAWQALKALQNPVVRPWQMKIRLGTPTRSGNIVLRTRNLLVGYPDNPLVLVEDVFLKRGERAVILGHNGTGKTTLLKTIMGELAPLDGRMEFGMGVKIGYFAQVQHQFSPDNTVLEELIAQTHFRISEARSWLARYLFRAEDVFKPISALSGGERAKLALAVLATRGANLLLLDEPTNHLDIAAQEVLQDALEAFEGTLLMVTHDRYLADRLATQIWSADDGIMSIFNGAYTEYTERMTA